jgi:hypothetical protein
MRIMYLLQQHNEQVLQGKDCWLLPVWGVVPNESAFPIDSFFHFTLDELCSTIFQKTVTYGKGKDNKKYVRLRRPDELLDDSWQITEETQNPAFYAA